jgi:hypothetical protein
MQKHPGNTDNLWDKHNLSPEDFNPCLLPVYIDVLREGIITIADLDFNEIDDSDIDDLETVLNYSPVNRLFSISEVFIGFDPSAATVRAFI